MLKLIVTGYAGREARVSTLPDGTQAINFSLAESYNYVDKESGEIQEKTTWIDVSYYRRSDQSVEVAKYIKKGTQLLIEGRVTASTYTNEKGKTLPVMKLYAQNIELLSQPREEVQRKTS
jgi:single-strand DNA-binding protein